jgi:hypothetical protein
MPLGDRTILHITVGLGFAAALALGACSPDPGSRTRLIARCRIEALRLYPAEPGAADERIGNYVGICMEAGGYQFDLRGPGCTPKLDPWRNPFCYRPTTPEDGG